MLEDGISILYLKDIHIFKEVEQVMVCHKIYQDQIKEKYLFDKDIEKAMYSNHDFHETFIGEIIKVINVY